MDLAIIGGLIDKGGWVLLAVGLTYFYFDKHPPQFILWFREFVAYRKDSKLSEDELLARKMDDLQKQEQQITGIRSEMIEQLRSTIVQQQNRLDVVQKMVTDCHAESAEHRVRLAEQDGKIGVLQHQNMSLATQNGVLMNTLDDMRRTMGLIEAVQRRHPELFNGA